MANGTLDRRHSRYVPPKHLNPYCRGPHERESEDFLEPRNRLVGRGLGGCGGGCLGGAGWGGWAKLNKVMGKHGMRKS